MPRASVPTTSDDASAAAATGRPRLLRAAEAEPSQADEATERAVADFRERKQIAVFGRNVPAPLLRFESTHFQGAPLALPLPSGPNHAQACSVQFVPEHTC